MNGRIAMVHLLTAPRSFRASSRHSRGLQPRSARLFVWHASCEGADTLKIDTSGMSVEEPTRPVNETRKRRHRFGLFVLQLGLLFMLLGLLQLATTGKAFGSPSYAVELDPPGTAQRGPQHPS